MAEAVTGTRRSYSVCSLILYVQPLIKAKIASTHASALNNVVGFWANNTDENGSLIKTGVDIGESSGTFTIRHGDATLGRNMDLYILTTEFE